MTDKLEPTKADNDVTVALTEWLINREVFFEEGPPKLEKIMHDFGAFADDLIARHRTTHSGEGQGWIVGNADGTKWRTWNIAGPEWTYDREQAIRYARRIDAERTHADDEDAWRIVPYSGEGRSYGAGEDAVRHDPYCASYGIGDGYGAGGSAFCDCGIRSLTPQGDGEVERLREALAPFARLAGPINGEEGRPTYLEAISGPNGTDELRLSTNVGDGERVEILDASDFRRARAALQRDAGGERV